ncbi:tripartite tricarboxylate transporter substrate binding protein, partial [Reyranella sp.]|uniref:Bug family tripartite tricarboxylate transporter substrate binding protein n=1 Tax=Reyranella sp. TaxID=1929291 RepID=UPI002730C86C
MTTLLHRRAVMAAALAAGTAGALTFPRRTSHADALASLRVDPNASRIVVPFAAGGTADILARVVADILAARMGTQFVVENRADAAGGFTAEMVARAAPDGRTLLLGTLCTAVTNQYLQKHLPYDATETFAPVALVGEMANVLVVHPSFPARTLAEFVDHSRRLGPNKVAYTSAGPGSAGHLAMEYLQDRAGIKLAHVAQRPRTRVREEILSGQTLVAMDSLPTYLNHIQSGQLRALSVSSANRWFGAPDIPTVAEQGFGAFDATQWWYVAVPAGTRRDLVAQYSEAIVAGLKLRSAVARIRAVGVQERPGTSEDLFLHIAAENLKWKKVIAS